MSQRMNDVVRAYQAVENSAGAIAPVAPTAVNATGFSRARFIFNFSNAATTGSLDTGLGLWHASTSGATYALIAGGSAVAVTSGAISGGANNVIIIDVPISSATPWLKASGSWLSTGVPHGAVIELYNGVDKPGTSTEQQVVVV